MRVAAALAVIAVAAAALAAVSPVRITSGSMAPAVEPGDLALVRPGRPAPERGAIVHFRHPFGTSGRAIKRVAALPGERVRVTDARLVVDGRTIPTAGAPDGVRPHTVVVPAGHVFVLGDNAAASWDSRGFGTVPAREVVGRVVLVLPGWSAVALPAVPVALAVALLLGPVLRRRRPRARRSAPA